MTVYPEYRFRSDRRLAHENVGRTFAAARTRLGRWLLAVLCLVGSALACFAQETTGTAASPPFWIQAANTVTIPYVTIALLVAGCLLLFHDLLTPTTWGVTGTLGVICMGVVFAAFIATGDRGWVGELLLLAGLAAVLLEVHVFPGFGSALLGFVLMFAGMFLCLGGTRDPAFALSITAFLIAVSGLAFLAYLPKSPAWRELRIKMQQQALVNGHGLPESPFLPSLSDEARNAVVTTVLAGQTGRTLTPLRPIGEADFNGIRVPVVTEGDFLPVNTPIVVTEVEDGRIVVAGVNEPVPDRV
ncbi:MAG: NfeD family protein [Capsulimonadales bacterium]|nr:NfeD family protein [Capsulimonadales bacterium]